MAAAPEKSSRTHAAAHLAPLADLVDLDAHLDIANDPFIGLRLDEGRIVLPEGPGLGVTQRAPFD